MIKYFMERMFFSPPENDIVLLCLFPAGFFFFPTTTHNQVNIFPAVSGSSISFLESLCGRIVAINSALENQKFFKNARRLVWN